MTKEDIITAAKHPHNFEFATVLNEDATNVEEAANVRQKDCLPITISKQRTTVRKYDSCKIIRNYVKKSKLRTMS